MSRMLLSHFSREGGSGADGPKAERPGMLGRRIMPDLPGRANDAPSCRVELAVESSARVRAGLDTRGRRGELHSEFRGTADER